MQPMPKQNEWEEKNGLQKFGLIDFA